MTRRKTKGSERRCDEREINNWDDDRMKRGRKDRNNIEPAWGKSNDQVDAKSKRYYETVIEVALRTERVFMGYSIVANSEKTLRRREYVVYLPDIG